MSLSKMLQEYREGLRCLPTYEELAAIATSAPMTPERFSEKMDELDKANPAPLVRLMASTEQCVDPIVERNVSLLRQRSTVGVEKYGTTLADNKLPLRAWLNHALEEALDQANYLQAAMAKIDSAAPKVADEQEAQRARVHAKVLAMPDSDMGNLIGPPMKCEIPPEGWYCTRMPGHEGPCAAIESASIPLVSVRDGDLQTALTVFDMGLGFALCHRDAADVRIAVKKLQSDFVSICAMIAARAGRGAVLGDLIFALENIRDYRSDVSTEIAVRSMRFYAEQALSAMPAKATPTPQ